jgi:hypothetical protein
MADLLSQAEIRLLGRGRQHTLHFLRTRYFAAIVRNLKPRIEHLQ